MNSQESQAHGKSTRAESANAGSGEVSGGHSSDGRHLAPFAMPGDGGEPIVGYRVDAQAEGLREAAGQFPTGVTVMAIRSGERDVVMTANSFTSVSLEPPLVSLCVVTQSHMGQSLTVGQGMGISILSKDQESVARQCASPVPDRCSGLNIVRHGDIEGALIDGASAWIVGTIDRLVEAGDHTIVLVKVLFTEAHSVPPLVFKSGKMFGLPS